jgi:hypothetical protein
MPSQRCECCGRFGAHRLQHTRAPGHTDVYTYWFCDRCEREARKQEAEDARLAQVAKQIREASE